MGSSNLSIEVLYFLNCPSWQETIKDLNTVLKELVLNTEITLTKVETNADVRAHKFPGSPTIRINDIDLFPVDLVDFALRCRVYQTPNGLKGTPTREMLKEQILKIF